jgi:hypothetical protein
MATQFIPSPRFLGRESFLDALARLAPDERLAIYRSGGFTHRECALWAADYPDEVPLVNDEFEWIALNAE